MQEEDMFDHDVLTRTQERDLLEQFNRLRKEHGPEHAKTVAVRNQLVLANMRLVRKIASKISGLPIEDRIGYGVDGLIKGIESFDISRPLRLGTYARHWVRAFIGRAASNVSRTVRIPVPQQNKRRRGQEYSWRGVALEGRPLSMDAPIGGHPRGAHENVTLHDCLPAEIEEPGDNLSDVLSLEKLHQAFARLPNASKNGLLYAEILAARFGLNDRAERTLKQIGDARGVSRERIRQLEAEALNELRELLQE